jgi:hypothetical protein
MPLKEKAPPAIWSAWASLIKEIDELKIAPADPVGLKNKLTSGLGARWAPMGLPTKELGKLYAQWEGGAITITDAQDKIKQWFAQTPFAKTGDFRATVVAAEFEFIQRATTEGPIWKQFSASFDAIAESQTKGSEPKAKYEIYGAGYFEDLSEKMARSFQIAFGPKSKENPFSERWLVFPDSAQAPGLLQSYQRFFANPEVIKHYGKLSKFITTAKNSGSLATDRGPEGGLAGVINFKRGQKNSANSCEMAEHKQTKNARKAAT